MPTRLEKQIKKLTRKFTAEIMAALRAEILGALTVVLGAGSPAPKPAVKKPAEKKTAEKPAKKAPRTSRKRFVPPPDPTPDVPADAPAQAAREPGVDTSPKLATLPGLDVFVVRRLAGARVTTVNGVVALGATVLEAMFASGRKSGKPEVINIRRALLGLQPPVVLPESMNEAK